MTGTGNDSVVAESYRMNARRSIFYRRVLSMRCIVRWVLEENVKRFCITPHCEKLASETLRGGSHSL